MWLSFYPMDQNLYLTIVEHYLAKTDMPMNDRAHALKPYAGVRHVVNGQDVPPISSLNTSWITTTKSTVKF